MLADPMTKNNPADGAVVVHRATVVLRLAVTVDALYIVRYADDTGFSSTYFILT